MNKTQKKNSPQTTQISYKNTKICFTFTHLYDVNILPPTERRRRRMLFVVIQSGIMQKAGTSFSSISYF